MLKLFGCEIIYIPVVCRMCECTTTVQWNLSWRSPKKTWPAMRFHCKLIRLLAGVKMDAPKRYTFLLIFLQHMIDWFPV